MSNRRQNKGSTRRGTLSLVPTSLHLLPGAVLGKYFGINECMELEGQFLLN